jgi:methylglutaconyl-CoA hydratase
MSNATPPAPLAPAEGQVITSVDAGVATVRFGHPKGNSLPGALLRALADAVRQAGEDPAARVVVLESDAGPGGRAPWCAGASFDELVAISEAGDREAGREFFSGFARVIRAMQRCPKFVVARIHGRVAGGGVGLAAAADYAVAVDGASCKLSELAVGIGPFVVGPVIERKVGLAAFTAMAVDADWRTAAWAHQHGLYARVVPDAAALDAAVGALAARLAASNPEAMADIKCVGWEGTEDWDALLAERADVSGRLVLSDFTRRAIAAYKAS